MTQEQKNLLLKDLCSRLPYGVKVESVFINPDTKEHKLCGIEVFDTTSILMIRDGLGEFKPYLFPLSSMTEEQLKEMQEIIGNPNEACISVNTSGLELWLNSIDTDPTIWLDTIFEVQNWLNKNHFDYRGLIAKGLAIDATNLNIY
jgi:hypothetical protein